MDPQALYVHFGRLLEAMPNLNGLGEYNSAAMQWLGCAHALVSASGAKEDATAFKEYMDRAVTNKSEIGNARRRNSVTLITAILHRQLAAAELKAPAASQGAFIPAGNTFDALSAFAKMAGAATKDLFVVDPYMDEKALMEFALTAPEGVTIRLLGDAQRVKETLKPAATRWVAQYGNKRPLSVRVAPAKSLHDRLSIVDQKEVWILTQSLNAIASRSPASIVRVEGDTASDKIDAYETIWAKSTSL